MSARNPVEIKLGDRSFTIRPTTIGQMVQIESVLTDPVIARSGIDLATRIILVGLSRDYPGETYDTIEAPLGELNDAMSAVLKLAGFETAVPAEAA